MGNPDLILLDEPSEGLAPPVVQAVGALIRQLRAMGVTILVAEHNMQFCLNVATHVSVVDRGQVVYRGTTDELRGDEAVKRHLAA